MNTKNLYYLRISDTHVIPLYIYLDERHVHWMNEAILKSVLADLRPLVIPKLAEQVALTVDTHRGDTYQFCFFTRKVEPYSILLKQRRHIIPAPIHFRPPSKRPRTDAYDPDDEKPKPQLQLAYQSIPLHVSICVVIEPLLRVREQTPLFLPEQDPDNDIMVFSQVLATMQHDSMGTAADETELEGAALFADADQRMFL